jgi:hypothetical protein
MVIDRLDRWTERALALIASPEGRRLYRRNKYEFGLNRRNNLCGLIEKACGRLGWEQLTAVYNRVEEALAEWKTERAAV